MIADRYGNALSTDAAAAAAYVAGVDALFAADVGAVEAFERAIETFLYRDQQKHENEMRLIQKQLPQAQAFYSAQTGEAKARIDRDLEGVNPYFKDKAFVNAALREKDRQTRREFANPVQAPAAGAKVAA
jgi:hypothetical protein